MRTKVQRLQWCSGSEPVSLSTLTSGCLWRISYRSMWDVYQPSHMRRISPIPCEMYISPTVWDVYLPSHMRRISPLPCETYISPLMWDVYLPYHVRRISTLPCEKYIYPLMWDVYLTCYAVLSLLYIISLLCLPCYTVLYPCYISVIYPSMWDVYFPYHVRRVSPQPCETYIVTAMWDVHLPTHVRQKYQCKILKTNISNTEIICVQL